MRALLIEDEQALATVLKRGLEKSGYAVDHLAEGKPAVDRLTLHRDDYDIAILDLMLPDMDGQEICQTVRERGVTTPIIVLTARSEVSDKVALLHTGADDYMVKPFSFGELLARLQALLRRPRDTLPGVLTIGSFTLDNAAHTISRNKRALELTLKEYMLLEYFLRYPNQVHSRDDIINHAWNFDFDSFSNTVDVHIKNLRRKIGSDGSKIIKTIRGVGYQFVA